MRDRAKTQQPKKYWRRHERVELSSIECDFSDGQRCYTETLLNLSPGGACIRIPREVEPGSQVTMILPSVPPVKVAGMVRWCRKQGIKYLVGVQFKALDHNQKECIKELISSIFWKTQVR